MGKINCFAYRCGGKCNATNEPKCIRLKGNVCAFCKTPEQYKNDCEKSIARIASLDYKKLKHVYEKYYLNNENQTPEFKVVMDREIKNIL